MIALQFQLLDKTHDRQSFTCGEKSLDSYLKQYASQDIKRNINRLFVATEQKQKAIVAYYSLSANSLDVNNLPEKIKSRLPKYPIPVSLLGRLAVSIDFQGQGIGKIVLADALKRVYHASQAMAVYAVVVDALDETAKQFYEKFGFIPLAKKKMSLFLPLQTIKQLD